jgi:hypothetical protein
MHDRTLDVCAARGLTKACCAAALKILALRKFAKLNDHLERVVLKRGGCLWTHTGSSNTLLQSPHGVGPGVCHGED